MMSLLHLITVAATSASSLSKIRSSAASLNMVRNGDDNGRRRAMAMAPTVRDGSDGRGSGGGNSSKGRDGSDGSNGGSSNKENTGRHKVLYTLVHTLI